MDEMKTNREIDRALRALKEQRDGKLGPAPTLMPARQASLTEVLGQEFPLESALREGAMKRDRLLDLSAGIPAPVELALRSRIAAQSTARKYSGSLFQQLIRSPFAAALAVCIMITAAVFFYRQGEIPSRRVVRNLTPDGASIAFGLAKDRGFPGRVELFGRTVSIRPFDLNKTEPASLQASFFTNSGLYFDDENDGRLGLRLDLPLRAILVERDLARIP